MSSMYSTIENGKVLDWFFQELQPGHYCFRIGGKAGINVGQVHKGRGWSAFANTSGPRIGVVEGFKSRHAAANFLLQLRRQAHDS